MEFKKIKNIKKIYNFNDFVYDIELEKNHYFKANNIWTHNCRLRSDAENRFFKEEIIYTLTLENGDILEISNHKPLTCKNIETNEIKDYFIDEIKNNLQNYEIIQ